MPSKVKRQLAGMAVMRKTVPGQAASIMGTTHRSRSNVPRPAASGRLKSCALAEPSMESSSEKPCFFMKPVRSGVRSVPFVVTEKRIRSPSSTLYLRRAGTASSGSVIVERCASYVKSPA